DSAPYLVIPARAGIQRVAGPQALDRRLRLGRNCWIPACAGMTKKEVQGAAMTTLAENYAGLPLA
ncbi:MAG TPA: hypothetical protein VMB73_26360, partial [Acetobacteraceae bacterium]|nr:hypothetical protein [Acetobacteraceae bacterium]